MAVSLKAVLGFDGKAYEAGLKKAKQLSKKAQKDIAGNLKGAILGTLSVGFLASKAKEMGEFAKQVKNLAPALGMTTGELQQWEYVFARAGLEIDDVADAFATLADRTEDALVGTESMIEDFRLVGITVDQLRGKNPQQLFELFADAVANTSDKNRALTSIVRNLGDDLGRKLAPMLMKGADGLREMREQAQKLGIIVAGDELSEIADKMVEIEIASMQLRSVWLELTAAGASLVSTLRKAWNLVDFIGPVSGGLGKAVGDWQTSKKSYTDPARYSDLFSSAWSGYKETVGRREAEMRAFDEAIAKKRTKGGQALTRASGGINDELEAKKAQEALQKKINDATFREMSREQQLNVLYQKRVDLFEKIKKAKGKQQFELMSADFDAFQQMKQLQGGAVTQTSRRAMTQTASQGVGAFVKRANPMLQVAREQLNVQRESKMLLQTLAYKGSTGEKGPY